MSGYSFDNDISRHATRFVAPVESQTRSFLINKVRITINNSDHKEKVAFFKDMQVIIKILFLNDDSITMTLPNNALFTVEDTDYVLNLLLDMEDVFNISPDHMLPFIPQQGTPLNIFEVLENKALSIICGCT